MDSPAFRIGNVRLRPSFPPGTDATAAALIPVLIYHPDEGCHLVFRGACCPPPERLAGPARISDMDRLGALCYVSRAVVAALRAVDSVIVMPVGPDDVGSTFAAILGAFAFAIWRARELAGRGSSSAWDDDEADAIALLGCGVGVKEMYLPGPSPGQAAYANTCFNAIVDAAEQLRLVDDVQYENDACDHPIDFQAYKLLTSDRAMAQVGKAIAHAVAAD